MDEWQTVQPWSDAAFCCIWSGSTLFAQARMYPNNYGKYGNNGKLFYKLFPANLAL